MVRIQVTYQGDLRCEAVHTPSGARIHTDAPTDNQGKGESFSPTDLVATAEGACMLTVMGIVARKNGWDIRGAEVTVDKEMIADPTRRIERLVVRVRMPAGLDAEARETLEHAALTCPVHTSVSPGIELPVTFEWDVVGVP